MVFKQCVAWQLVWRTGVAPQLSTDALKALRRALETDDVRLLQGGTVSPPPLQCMEDWEPEAACPIAYAGWLGEGLGTVGAVESYFTRVCLRANELVGDPVGVSYFLNAVDNWEREQMRQNLLPEVIAVLDERAEQLRGRQRAVVVSGC